MVKGVSFVDLVDAGDPVELAARYDAEGADELVFLDITASAEERETLVELVARTAEEVFIPLTVGGGVRGLEDARRLLRAGADKVSVNTAAVSRPSLVEELAGTFGSQCIVVAIDAKAAPGGWQVYTHGGRRATGLDAVEWAQRCQSLGAGELLVTSMDRDGTERGYDIPLLRQISSKCDVPLVASGGVGSVEHLVQGAEVADGLLAASIFHFGTHTVGEVKRALATAGVLVRPLEDRDSGAPGATQAPPPLRQGGSLRVARGGTVQR